jgi:hypothetical protein
MQAASASCDSLVVLGRTVLAPASRRHWRRAHDKIVIASAKGFLYVSKPGDRALGSLGIYNLILLSRHQPQRDFPA